ncbi:MAG: tRNA (N6-isopentenyl adenosine(37)-C2)-methylthiotransferase MiaB [bacterium]
MQKQLSKQYYLFTLGCQMNESDAERISSLLEQIGYSKTTSEKEAGIIVVIACSVRQKAVDRIVGKSRNWQKRRRRRELITILSGCVLPTDKVKMKSNFDIILDIKDIPSLPTSLSKLTDTFDDINPDSDYFKIFPKYKSSFQAYLPIMTGCDQFCTYCAVPFTRGREVSRPASEILAEFEDLVKKGYKEITLLGQTIDKYENPDKNSSLENLADLFKACTKFSGDYWIRFFTSHPNYFSDELIDIIATEPKIGNFVHLPVQAGNNNVLHRMNRRYTIEHYLEIVKILKKQIPNLNLSTDLIVGFSGETKKEFEDSLKLFNNVKFDMAYTAMYSPRPGTASAKVFPDDVSKEEKKRRELELTKVLKKHAFEINKSYVGKEFKVLVEMAKHKNGQVLLQGKTQNFKSIQFEGFPKLVGSWQNILVTKALPLSLFGKIKGIES